MTGESFKSFIKKNAKHLLSKCENVPLFSVLRNCKLTIFGLCTISQTKQTI